jgi:hypothetical protein
MIRKIPGFTAEASLSDAGINYNNIMHISRIQAILIPQQFDCWWECDQGQLSCFDYCTAAYYRCIERDPEGLCVARLDLCDRGCNRSWFICNERCVPILI